MDGLELRVDFTGRLKRSILPQMSIRLDFKGCGKVVLTRLCTEARNHVTNVPGPV